MRYLRILYVESIAIIMGALLSISVMVACHFAEAGSLANQPAGAECAGNVSEQYVGAECTGSVSNPPAGAECTEEVQEAAAISAISTPTIEDVFAGENAEILHYLDKEVFAGLSDAQKWDVLRSVMYLECAYLGCEPEKLVIYKLEDRTIAGYHSQSKHRIELSANLLDQGPMRCLEVLLHEVYHAYQHQCVEVLNRKNISSDLIMFREVEQWKYEFSHYCSVNENSTDEERQKYRKQSVEISADEYASQRMQEYRAYFRKL